MTDKDFLAPMPVANEGNFLMQKDFLSARLEYVMSLELTAENIERVRSLKRGIVGWRTSFKKQVDEYIREHFNAPKDIYKAAANEVLAEIETLEGKADAVLAEEERKRVEAVDFAIDGIIESLRGGALPDEWVDRIERRKQYYNKTADMAQTAEDIKKQFADLLYQYNEERTSEEAVRKACADDKRIDVDLYASLLERMPLGQVLEKVNQRKEELAKLTQITEGVEGIKVEMPEEQEDEMKEIDLHLRYPARKAQYLNTVFSELTKHGILVAWATVK